MFLYSFAAAVLGGTAANQTSDSTKFDRLLAQFQTFFEGEEDKGPQITAALANLVDASLRRKPNDASVKTTLAKYPVPENMPHLQVPKTNPDVQEALSKTGSIQDFNLRKVQLAIAKAMVPILHWMHDFGDGKAFSFDMFRPGFY